MISSYYWEKLLQFREKLKLCTKMWFFDTFLKTNILIKLIRVKFLTLTLFRMGLLGPAHGWGGGKKAPLSKICHTYPTLMKLGTIAPYLKKIQEIHKSRIT